MDIIVDTREQLPLQFGKHNTIRFKLFVGDYSTVKLRELFCIERKSLEDLYGTIIQGHVRFRNEIIRAHTNNIELVIVVEGTKKDFQAKNFSGGKKRKTTGETLIKIVNTIESKYKVPIVWCKNREESAKYIRKSLQLKEKQLCKSK
jgi:ERCC4-type nuclease